MNKSHWDSIYQDSPLQEPESPSWRQVAAGVKEQLAEVRGRILLLSANPMFSNMGFDVTAVDRNKAVVRARWLGNAPGSRAVIADWFQLPFATSSFSACVGDVSTNVIPHPESVRALYESAYRVLLTGGRFVCRILLTPDAGETVAEVSKAALQGRCRSFLYLKFRLAMAIAAEQSNPSVPVRSIHAAFNANFPDRDRLADVSGCNRREIDKIDLYGPSPEIYSFPTRQQCLAVIPPEFVNVRFVAVGSYELAERCPLLVMEKA
jgi:SAM-dependent methyltransferase